MSGHVKTFLAHPRWPGLPQALALVLALVTVVALFVGPDRGERNLGSFLLWHLWWAGLPLAAVLLGRIWCAICPVSLLDTTLGTRRPRPLRWPALLGRHEGLLLAGSILLAHLINLWFRLEDSAPASRGYVAALIAAAIAATLLVRGRPWCRALCPAGAFSGILARLAPWTLAADPVRCLQSCAGGLCRGGSGTGACPVGEDPRRGIDPGVCILCGDCLEFCPGVRPVRASCFRLPGSAAAATLVLLGIVVDALLVQINDWPVLFWRLCATLGVAPGPWQELTLHAMVATTPLLAALLLTRMVNGAASGERTAMIAGAALPVAAASAAALAARELLVTAPRHLGELLAAAGYGGYRVLAFSRHLDGLPIRALQESLLALGLLAALRRLAPDLREPGGRATAFAAAVFSAAACALLAWGFSLPSGS